MFIYNESLDCTVILSSLNKTNMMLVRTCGSRVYMMHFTLSYQHRSLTYILSIILLMIKFGKAEKIGCFDFLFWIVWF
jgi:hypothetical protein